MPRFHDVTGKLEKKTPPLKNCADEKKNLRKNSRHFVSVCQYFGDLRFAVSFSPFSFCQTFCQTHGWHSFYFRLRRPLDGGRVAGSIPDSSVRFTSLHSHPILRMVFLSKRFLNHFSTEEETRDLFITNIFVSFQIYKYL